MKVQESPSELLFILLEKCTHREADPSVKKPIIIKCILPVTIQPILIATKIKYLIMFIDIFLKIIICRKNITRMGLMLMLIAFFLLYIFTINFHKGAE